MSLSDVKSELKQVIRPAKVVHDPGMVGRFLEEAKKILESGWMVLGYWTEKFEESFARYVGRKYGVACQNDTGGLEMMMAYYRESRRWERGFEVLMPATAFFSCVTAVRRAGGRVIPVDIEVENGIHSTVRQFKEAMTPDTRAIWAVYAGGYVARDIEDLRKFCGERGLVLIEDAAHTHGSRIGGRMAGSWGDAAGWSFFATKVLNTLGEGGFIATEDEGLVRYAKTYRNYGRSSDFGSSTAAMEGFNYRITEMQALMGVLQVERAEEKVEERNRVARLYDERLSGEVKGLSKVTVREGERLNYYRYVTMLEEGLNKEKVKRDLKEKFGVNCPGDVYDAVLQDQKIFPELRKYDTPKARDYCRRHLCLPLFEGMTEGEVDTVVSALKEVVG